MMWPLNGNNEDRIYELARDRRMHEQDVAKDWRAGCNRFYKNPDDRLFYVSTPMAWFGTEEQAQLDAMDSGWRRLWRPERFGLNASADWSPEQRIAVLQHGMDFVGVGPKCVQCSQNAEPLCKRGCAKR